MSARTLASAQKAAPRAKPKVKRSQAAPRAKQRTVQRPKAEWSFAPSLTSGHALKAVLQPELEVGPPDDEFEQEADRVADRIVTMPEGAASGDAGEGEEDEVQRKPAEDEAEDETAVQGKAAPLQRACENCAEEDKEKGAPVQRQEDVEDEPPSGVQAKVQREETEEEAAQTATLQRQDEEEDATAQTTSLQRQEEEENTTAQTASLQRQEEEETAQATSAQRRESDEETAQTVPIQRRMEDEQETAQAAPLQRRMPDDEETAQTSSLQRQADEEDTAQTAALLRRAMQEEEETAQTTPLLRKMEEEETAQPASMQRKMEEEETAQASPLQRAMEEEETARAASVQQAAEQEDEATARTFSLQRQSNDEDEAVQAAPPLQRGMSDEEEAAQTASLHRMEDDAAAQRACAECGPEKEDEQKAGGAAVQRRTEGPDEEEERSQRHFEPGESVGSHFSTMLRQARGGGTELPNPVRDFFERRFRRDFSGVRVHHDQRASELAESIRARAFTTGRHIFFRRGDYRPGTQQGQRLIAHELTHVLQQRGGLHSVQRELFEPGEEAGKGDSGSEQRVEDAGPGSIESLLHLFGIPAGAGNGEARSAAREILGAALSSAELREEVNAVVAPTARNARRTLRSKSYTLSLSAEMDVEAGAIIRQWKVMRADGTPVAQGSARGSATPELELTGGADEADFEIEVRDEQRATETAETGLTAPATGLELASADSVDSGEQQPAASDAVGPEAPSDLLSGAPTARDATEQTAGGEASETTEPPTAEETSLADGEGPATDDAADELSGETPSLGGVEEEADAAAAPQKESAQAIEDAITQAAEAAEGAEPEEAPPGEQVEEALEAARPAAEGEGEDAGAEAAAGEAPLEPEGGAGGGGAAEAPAEGEEIEIPEADVEAEATDMEARLAEAAGDSSAVEEEAGAAETDELALEEAGIEEEEPALEDTALLETPEPEEVAEPPELEAEPEEPEAEEASPPPLDTPAVSAEEGAEPVETEPPETPEPVAPPAPTEEPAEEETQADPALEREIAAEEADALADTTSNEDEGEALADEIPDEAATDSLTSPERDAAIAALGEGALEGSGEPSGGGGGGGGGGGAEPEPVAAPPDVSSMEPAAAMSAVASLPPASLQRALGGVTASANSAVGSEREALAANPPSVERPTGSPLTKAAASQTAPAPVPLPGTPDATNVNAVPLGADLPTPEAQPLPEAPPPAIAGAATPAVSTDEEGTLTANAANAVRSRLANLPTSDPALRATAGAAPTVSLEGNADPNQLVEQHGELREKLQDARKKGAQEAAEPMGEQMLFPEVPEETLEATVSAGGGGGGAGGAAAAGGGAGGGGDDNTLSIIAEEEKGAEISGAVTQAQSDITGAESEHDTKVKEAETTSTEAIAAAEQDNAQKQQAERAKAQGEVSAKRGEWAGAQQDEIRGADADASENLGGAAQEIAGEQTRANDAASNEIEKGNEEAERERQKGEQAAARERQRGASESGGIFGWVASKATAFFNAIKEGIKGALAAARALVKAAIEKAKELAVGLIEKARKFIVDKIKAAGDFLIKIGDKVLANFPGLREKFRNAIKTLVAAAEDAINKLAEGLKKAVTALLDSWGALLDAALGLFEKALLAAVDAVAAVVDGAIKFAKSVADKLGLFAQFIADIAPNIGGWIGKLGSAIAGGIKNHLWGALKEGVKEWFSSKLEGIVGIGATLWKLVTGELGLAEVGRMAIEAIKAVLPPIVISVILQQVAKLVNPVVGGIITVIEALVAAWGTISRIIATINLFIDFLKAVKGGGAAPKFATALASAAIVLLDFVANFLLAKLGSALAKFAGKLRGIAKRLQTKKAAKKGKPKAKAKRDRAAARAGRGARGRGARGRGARPSRRPTRPRGRPRPGRGARGRPRRPRQQRPRPLPPPVIISRVLRTLSRPARARKPEAAIREKQQQATRLRSQLQRRAPRGRTLTITLDRSVQGVLQDDDIDFTVALSPGVRGQANVNVTLLSKFNTQINASHPAAVSTITKAVKAIDRKTSNVRNIQWPGLQKRIMAEPLMQGIKSRPIGSHAFGRAIAATNVLESAWKTKRDATKIPSPRTISRLRTRVNTEGRFASARGLILEAVFQKRPNTKRIIEAIEPNVMPGPAEPFDREKHYGSTPTAKDRDRLRPLAIKMGFLKDSDWVADHRPALVIRYYVEEQYKLSGGQRREDAKKRLAPQAAALSPAQGGRLRGQSLKFRKKFFGY